MDSRKDPQLQIDLTPRQELKDDFDRADAQGQFNARVIRQIERAALAVGPLATEGAEATHSKSGNLRIETPEETHQRYLDINNGQEI